MYCPKCGAQNIAEAKFCRMCGTAFQTPSKPAHALEVLPNDGRAFRSLFIGGAFLIIVLISIFSRTGFFWWMLFPAISLLSKGVRRLNKLKRAHLYHAPPQQLPLGGYQEVRVRPTGELVPPPSVTENTTKLFDRQ